MKRATSSPRFSTCPRFWPIANTDALVDATAVDEARQAAAARARGAPFAYAVGRAAFRYLTLAVDERVLIPRQETEVLIDLVLAGRAGRTRHASSTSAPGRGR